MRLEVLMIMRALCTSMNRLGIGEFASCPVIMKTAVRAGDRETSEHNACRSSVWPFTVKQRRLRAVRPH